GKEILMNELGVVYRKPGATAAGASRSEEQKDLEGDPELVNIEGTVDGSVYRHRAAHYEWMLGVGEPVGLGYDDLGKRGHARPAEHAVLRRGAEADLRQRGPDDRRGGELRGGELGGGGVLAGAGGRAPRDQEGAHPEPAAGVLHLAQPGRGPARRPRDGGAGGGVLRPGLRPGQVHARRARDARRPGGGLGPAGEGPP